jgi:hypothetical protein
LSTSVLLVLSLIISRIISKAQSNNLVKEIKTKEKLEDRIKGDHDQMEKIKIELGIVKNNFKKSETNMEKLNETLKDLKVILKFNFYLFFFPPNDFFMINHFVFRF